MKLINNGGTDRVIDLMRPHLKPGHQLGCVTPSFSLFAFAELRDALATLKRVQLILPPADDELNFLGGDGDRAARNRLQARWLRGTKVLLDGDDGHSVNPGRVFEIATVLSLLGFARQRTHTWRYRAGFDNVGISILMRSWASTKQKSSLVTLRRSPAIRFGH